MLPGRRRTATSLALLLITTLSTLTTLSFLLALLGRYHPSLLPLSFSPSSSSSSSSSSSQQQALKPPFSLTNPLFPPSSSQPQKACTRSTALRRPSWSDLTTPQKRSFIKRILCIQSLPSIHPAHPQPPDEPIAAARTLYDDFTAVHIANTPRTHKSGLFLPWHRHFNALFERALLHPGLRCEGDEGEEWTMGIPYWDWGVEGVDEKRTGGLFERWTRDGSSMGGDGDGDGGAWVDADNENRKGDATTTPPKRRRRGCLTTGPFANISVPFRPIDLDGAVHPSSLATWRLSQPNCLSRDLQPSVPPQHLTESHVSAALAAPDMDAFTRLVAGPANEFALHGWAHYAVGGQMSDSFVASADPVFWLHHSMVDRLWAIWQEDDPGRRRYAHCCEDREGLFREPGLAEKRVSNETVMDFGWLGGEVRVGDVADTLGGMYCYRYD